MPGGVPFGLALVWVETGEGIRGQQGERGQEHHQQPLLLLLHLHK